MAKIGKYLPLVVSVLIALVLQVVFMAADITDNPEKAAAEFVRAYYLLDEDAMNDRLCRKADVSGMIDDYLYDVQKQAADRGFSLKYMRAGLSHMEINTLEKSDKTAKIEIIAQKRSAINPVFGIVAKLFCLTKAHDVSDTYDLVKENGCWRVCGRA